MFYYEFIFTPLDSLRISKIVAIHYYLMMSISKTHSLIPLN